jgi:hypothetical protein
MHTVIRLYISDRTSCLETRARHLRARTAVQQTVTARQITRSWRDIVARIIGTGGHRPLPSRMQRGSTAVARREGTRTPKKHERPGQRPGPFSVELRGIEPPDLLDANSRQQGSMESFAHVRRSAGGCSGSLGGPRLLYFAAVQQWTAAGGGLPRAVCGDQAQNPGLVHCLERVASGGRWPVVSRGLYAATVTVIVWGTTFSSGTGSPESCRSSM